MARPKKERDQQLVAEIMELLTGMKAPWTVKSIVQTKHGLSDKVYARLLGLAQEQFAATGDSPARARHIARLEALAEKATTSGQISAAAKLLDQIAKAQGFYEPAVVRGDTEKDAAYLEHLAALDDSDGK